MESKLPGYLLFFFTMGIFIAAYSKPLEFKFNDKVEIIGYDKDIDFYECSYTGKIKRYYYENKRNFYKVRLDYCSSPEANLSVKIVEGRLEKR